MNIDLLPRVRSLEAVILFGSHARGDSDDNSDIDICAVVQCEDFEQLSSLRDTLTITIQEPTAAISIFELGTFQQMAARGSLLLHHIKNEGSIVWDRHGDIARFLEELCDFNRYEEEFDIYSDVVTDIIDSIATQSPVSECDLAALFSVVRNVGILLCHASDHPRYGRQAYLQAKESYNDLIVTKKDMQILEYWYLVYSRDAEAKNDLPAISEAIRIAQNVKLLVDQARGILS